MAGKIFTDEQKAILNENPYVESVEDTRIIYTEEFKIFYVQNYLNGKKPTEIFISAGFDPSILGNKRIERASARWRKLYAEGTLKIAEPNPAAETIESSAAPETTAAETTESTETPITTAANPAETAATAEVEEAAPAVEQTDAAAAAPEPAPAKKRRGRPRKNKEAEAAQQPAAPKKKRGRPRKNPTAIEAPKTTKTAKATKKRTSKIAAMAQTMTAAPENNLPTVTVTTAETTAPLKKRRGRPRKNPLAAAAKLETPTAIVEQPQKKRRGRPRKNPITPVETAPKAAAVPSTKTTAASIAPKQPAAAENIAESLLTAINNLVKEVNSLKRQIAGQKKVTY